MNVFKLMATLGLDASKYDQGLSSAESSAKSFGEKLKSGLGTAAKLTGAALTATTAAAVKLTKDAIESYAEYEQLVGGVETLFKDSADTVLQYAQDAYKTAGLSANEYMDTVTSFSASLLQSLDGDTAKAAEYSNRAIKDMADNANKMGTNIKSIQTAYQGFAKQNYTMLDNLKLGYGGTKAEMERLIMDANKLAIEQGLVDESALKLVVDEEAVAKASEAVAKAEAEVSKKTTALQKAQLSYNAAVEKGGKNSTSAQKAALNLKTAQENLATSQKKLAEAQNSLTAAQEGYVSAFDINSYADITEAIHLVQTNMGITGTTALEASSTISGSIASMKSAWQNLVTGIADENADFDTLVGNFVESASTAAENILPRIEIALSGIGEVVERLAPIVAEAIPTLVNDVIPTVASAGVTLFVALIDNIDDIISGIADNLPNLVDGIVEAITGEELIKKIVMAGIDFFVALVGSIPEILDGLAEGLRQIVDGIKEWFEKPENQEKMRETGTKLLSWIIDGIFHPEYDVFGNKLDSRGLPAMITEGLGLTQQGWHREGRGAGGSWGDGFTDGISNSMEENGEQIWGSVRPRDIVGYGKAITDWEDAGTEMADGLRKGWMDQSDKDKDDIIGKVQELILLTEDELGIHSPSRVFMGIGENMAKGLKQGFNNQIPDIKAELRRQARSLVTAVQNELQIKSPSKVFAKIGQYMAQGLGEGFEAGMEDVRPIITEAIPTNIDGVPSGTRGKVEITQNIYAEKMTPAQVFQATIDAQETAEFLGYATPSVA